MAIRQPRNADIITKDGQLNQEWVRYFQANENQTTAAFTGDTGSGGVAGLVPAPASGDAEKFLKGNGTWSVPIPPDATLIETVNTTSGSSVTSSTIDTAALKLAGYRNLALSFNGISLTSGLFLVHLSDDDGVSYTPSSADVTGLGIQRDTAALSVLVQQTGIIPHGTPTSPANTINGGMQILDFAQTNTALPKLFTSGCVESSTRDAFGSGSIIGLAGINKVQLAGNIGTFDAGSFSIFAV